MARRGNRSLFKQAAGFLLTGLRLRTVMLAASDFLFPGKTTPYRVPRAALVNHNGKMRSSRFVKRLNKAAVCVCSCLVIGLAAPIHARSIEELNLSERITLTLANSISPDYRFGPDDIEALMRRMDFYADPGEGIYTYSFRIQEGNFTGRGYYRVAEPGNYPKPKSDEGWVYMGEDRESGAKVWFREMRKARVAPYNEVQASVERNLVLTTSMRRPAEESREKAREAVLERVTEFIKNARLHGILSRVEVELVGAERTEQVADGGLLNLLGRERQATSVLFRVYALDHQERPAVNVDKYIIKLGGFLGRFASIEGATFNAKKERYEVPAAQGGGADITLVIPAMAAGEFARALEQNAVLKEGYGIVVDVNAAYRSPRGDRQ